ncbi:MAG: hypothetical protein ABJZ69_18055 [Hyphomicrobiales bacterium]
MNKRLHIPQSVLFTDITNVHNVRFAAKVRFNVIFALGNSMRLDGTLFLWKQRAALVR